MSKKDESKLNLDDIPHERNEPRPDFSTPPRPSKLPKSIQDTLDNEEKLWETVYAGKGGESTDSNLRYAAYASRIRTVLLAAHRYIAYTSDIGESFRPIAHPNLVRGAYAVSWLYIGGDVAHEGYKAYIRNQHTLHPEKYSQDYTHATDGRDTTVAEVPKPARVVPIDDYRAVMAQRAVFQSLASMGLPAFTIHSIVRYSGRAMKDMKNKTVRTWAPIGLGLAAVPFLPFIFDKPIEHTIEWIFHKGFEVVGGPQAVAKLPTEVPLGTNGKLKEKEL
ncbi:mitochondrial 18kDa protein [Rhizodiscina lignyota]|uniref:Mitochondrial fission process protein 1 n=1 Tax=Rhizodiscina lignyota TaxID=1504668 RepID=A0A9P4M8Y1_9PEZI|nr:mitochondrial 18kDa protein [Rhizodiscina lignyota]